MKRNIVKEYIFTFFYNLNFTRGLWMIYLATRGFSLVQLGIMESTFHVTSFLMEIPTGAVADIWGKKISRIAGRVIFISSLLIMLYSRSFAFQLIGFTINAVGYNLESGAGEAFLYDSIIHVGLKKAYMSFAGRKEFVLQFSSIVALLLGGYIATKSYPAVFFLSFFSGIMAIITALTFLEPPSKTPREKQGNVFLLIRNQTIDSLRVIKKRRKIAFYILFSELIFAFTVSLFFYLQNFWKGQGYSEFRIGLIFAAASLLSGIASLLTHRIEKKIGGEQSLIIAVPILVILAFWGIALTRYEYLFYLLVGIMEGLLYVAISDYINRIVPSEYRATVLSFQSMVFSFFMIILFPVIGWLGEHFGLDKAFLTFSILATVLGAAYFLYMILTRNRDS